MSKAFHTVGIARIVGAAALVVGLLARHDLVAAAADTRRLASLVGRLTRAIDATRVDGDWVAVTALAPPQRERVDGAVGAALETLARVPGLLRIGTT